MENRRKSTLNIIAIILTVILSITFVSYGVFTAYITKLQRSADAQASYSDEDVSNDDTLDIAEDDQSSFSMENFSNLNLAEEPATTLVPENSFGFDLVGETTTTTSGSDYTYKVSCNGRTITNTGINSGNSGEPYIEDSECYIYTKLQIEGFNSSFVNSLNDINNILEGFEVSFELDNIQISGSDQTYNGSSCWSYFCKWNIQSQSNTNHSAKITLDTDGTFYVAVRINKISSGIHSINVKYNGNILDSFEIKVYSRNELESLAEKLKIKGLYYNQIKKTSSTYGSYYDKNDGISFVANILNNGDYGENKEYPNSVTPSSDITLELAEQWDYFATNNNRFYSSLNTSYDLKVLLIYPNADGTYDYELVENPKLINTGTTTGNYRQYYKFDDITHTIPSDWSKETYTVTEVVFNMWYPMGQYWCYRTHTYNVDLVSIDENETKEQAKDVYAENSEVYTYVVLNYKENEAQLENISVRFTIGKNGEYVEYSNSENRHTGTGTYNLSNNGRCCYDKFTLYNDDMIYGTITDDEDNKKYVAYFAIRWVTPDVSSGLETIPIKVEVYNGSNLLDEPYFFDINVYDIDFINEYQSIADYSNDSSLDLSKSKNKENVLAFENATKQYYKEKGKYGTLSDSLNEFYKTCLATSDIDIENVNYQNRTSYKVEFDNSSFSYWNSLIDDDDDDIDITEELYNINNLSELLDYNCIYNNNNNLKGTAGESICIPTIGTDDTKNKSDSSNWCNDTKIILLYPEYGYNIAFGDLLTVEDYKNNSNYIFETTIVESNRNETLSKNNNHHHTIPLWWDEDEYTVVAIYFGKFSPLGQIYYTEKITYDVEGTVYGDWYITRNTGN